MTPDDRQVEHRITRIETILVEHERALTLQRQETDRRLTELNGEAGRLRGIQERFTTNERTDALDARVKLLESSQSAYAGRRETQTEVTGSGRFNTNLIVTVILAAAAIVAAYILRH